MVYILERNDELVEKLETTPDKSSSLFDKLFDEDIVDAKQYTVTIIDDSNHFTTYPLTRLDLWVNLFNSGLDPVVDDWAMMLAIKLDLPDLVEFLMDNYDFGVRYDSFGASLAFTAIKFKAYNVLKSLITSVGIAFNYNMVDYAKEHNDYEALDILEINNYGLRLI